MVPPLDFILKIGDQLFRCSEDIDTFLSIKMLMIAFTQLIIKSQHTFSVHYISKPVLKFV